MATAEEAVAILQAPLLMDRVQQQILVTVAAVVAHPLVVKHLEEPADLVW
jgi:hypothetical protein